METSHSDITPPRRSVTDHILSTIKAALSSLPFTGGIASLIADYVPSSTEKSIRKAISALRKRLDQLGERVDVAAVDPDEFSDAVKSFLLLTQRTSREEKLRGAGNLLANLLLTNDDPERLTYTEADHFWRCLDALSIGAIRLLGLICQEMNTRGLREAPGGEYMFAAGDVVPMMNDLSPHLVLSLVAELDALNLLRKAAASVSLASQGYRENDAIFLTRTGLRFVEMVLQAGHGEE